jgi:hypothetical protein
MGVERKLNQGTLDGNQIDTGRRDGHARERIGGVRPLNGNRCMLLGTRPRSHDWGERKHSTGDRR